MNPEGQKRKPEDGYWNLVGPAWDVIDIYEGPDVFLQTFGGVSRPAAVLFAAHFCQSEVCNGGFDQFFFNSTGVLAPEAIDGFRAIGQMKVAEVVQRACSLFGQEYPRERQLRQSMLGAIDKKSLDQLDKEFYSLIHDEQGGFEEGADRYAESTG